MRCAAFREISSSQLDLAGACCWWDSFLWSEFCSAYSPCDLLLLLRLRARIRVRLSDWTRTWSRWWSFWRACRVFRTLSAIKVRFRSDRKCTRWSCSDFRLSTGVTLLRRARWDFWVGISLSSPGALRATAWWRM